MESPNPTPELVKCACREFDEENRVTENALRNLFQCFPHNTEASEVLLKVLALNDLYSTRIPLNAALIPNVFDVASHIHQRGRQIDLALDDCSREIVKEIANVGVTGKADRCYYSFATKYCSWHRPDKYPIYDSRVDKYLWSIRSRQKKEPSKGREPFASSFQKHDDFWVYPAFVKIMDAFRDTYGLQSFTFKEIDKFLWSTEPRQTQLET